MSNSSIFMIIDTADSAGCFDLTDGDKIIVSRELPPLPDRDTALSSIVHDLLNKANADFSALEGIIINEGPGSFTGLRLGSAYAKAICYLQNLPLIPVNGLEAMAFSAIDLSTSILPLIHSKGNDYYYALFKSEKEGMVRLKADGLINGPKLVDIIEHPVLVVISGEQKYRPGLEPHLKGKITGWADKARLPLSEAFAQIGLKKLQQGKSAEIFNYEPKYLQNFCRSS